MATLEAIAYTGARIVLVDVAPPTYTLDIEAVRAAITDKTKAIVPVHIFGQPCDIDAVYDLAAERNLAVIEDASQAHGAQWRGRRIGSRGIASFSFYPGKNLGAYGEGGGVTSNDAAFDERMRELRNHGGLAKYVHSVVGYNYRMDGIQGAVLDVKLPHLEEWTEGRRRAAHRYDHLLAGVPKPEVPNDARHVYHIYRSSSTIGKPFAPHSTSAASIRTRTTRSHATCRRRTHTWAIAPERFRTASTSPTTSCRCRCTPN